MNTLHSVLYLNLVILIFTGCSSSSRLYRKNDELSNWQKIKSASVNAVESPNVWVPAMGASVIQLGNLDRNISEWGWKNTLIFRSQKSARNFSNIFLYTSIVIYVSTVIIAPVKNDSLDWGVSKLQNGSVGILSILATISTTGFLKKITHRARPDKSNDRSFPSGHTSAAAVSNILSQKNIGILVQNKSAFQFAQYLPTGLTLATAWARVEAKKHYLSDTLVGMALGNFLGLFFFNLFDAGKQHFSIQVSQPYGYDTVMLNVSYQFH